MTKLTARFLAGIAAFAASVAITLVGGVAPASAAGLSQFCQDNYLAYGFSSPHDCLVGLDQWHHVKHR